LLFEFLGGWKRFAMWGKPFQSRQDH